MSCIVASLVWLLAGAARAETPDSRATGSAVAARLRAAPAAPTVALRSEQERRGTLRSRLSDEPADVVLLYGGEQEGELGTCGCDANPRGSFARVDRYRRAVASEDAPVLLLGAGGLLSAVPGDDGRLRADVVVRDRYVADALAVGGWDVVNLGYRDLPWVAEHGLPIGVSANVRAPGLATHRLVEVGGLRIAVTGVTGDGLRHLRPDGWTVEDPVGSLAALVPTLDADLVVVLGYDLGPVAADVAAVPGVGVLIEAGGYEGRYDATLEGSAVWVRNRTRTEQLGELRLTVEEGRVVAAVDRKIDLDARIRPTAAIRRLERRADRDVKDALVEVYGDLVR